MGRKRTPNAMQPSLFGESESTLLQETSPNASLPPAQLKNFPKTWASELGAELASPYFAKLQEFLEQERLSKTILPEACDVFNAYAFTPPDQVRVVILGQDPYPTPGHAHGLCFSVRPGVSIPASLRNIYQELQSDLGFAPVKHGHLVSWAKQGVLLLNSVLTVESGRPASHANKGWESFTDATLKVLNERPDPIVFLLWGAYAQKKARLLNTNRHKIIASAHPSPLSACAGFFGSKPFSKANAALAQFQFTPINWQLPPMPE